MNKLIVGVCTLVELGCITALAAIGLKRNNDAYKAELKAIDAECKCYSKEIEIVCKDAEIKNLKKELEKLKAQKEESN